MKVAFVPLFRNFCFFLFILFAHKVPARSYSLQITPRETDKSIANRYGDHFVAMNPWVIHRGVLFLFLPGTGSKATNYKLICETAADQGFHALSLQYPNEKSVNFSCAQSKDLGCNEKMRREILFGSDFSPLVNVNRDNCIENRLVKLLTYLSQQFPLDGWEQFLTSGGAPRWSKILVAGHSQGGGHAALIGKYYSTAGVIMFSTMDYNYKLKKPAAWIHLNSQTKIDKFFAVSHTGDQTMPYFIMRKYWNSFGFKRLGPVANIDRLGSPYNNAHALSTSIAPSRLDKEKSNYHNVICMDADTPLSVDGRALLTDLWVYLLNAPLGKK